MALPLEMNVRERLQPSLLDRLTDEEPANLQEGADKRVMSATRLKASVVRDLTWLLNTTSSLNVEGSLDLAAATSVINYGLPALAGNSSSSVDVRVLEGLIHRAIATYEPRILRHTLRVRAQASPEHMTHNALSFEIEGDLWAQPLALPLLLRTHLDLESGHVHVMPAEQRRRS